MKTRIAGDRLYFWCPGCDGTHGVRIKSAGEPNGWEFDGDRENPTIKPSILVSTNYDDNGRLPEGQIRTICHSFVTAGTIQFCGDSPHKLSGQTVILPHFPDGYAIIGETQD